MKVSVIICTYNRAESLAETLQSLNGLVPPEDTAWELIVVDNNSKDHTKSVFERFAGMSGADCRMVRETRQGLSNARNKGIAEATGDVIAFTDDDVVITSEWLRGIARAFQDDSVACVGGRILPMWETPKPRWLEGPLLNCLALLDLGNEMIRLTKPTLWGANLAIRTSMFRRYGFFDDVLGNTEGKLFGGEETSFVETILKGGETVLYCPEILVYHRIPARRILKSYFRKWMFDKGELRAIRMGRYDRRNIKGVPFYSIRELLEELVRYGWKQLSDPGTAFPAQLILMENLGFILGRFKYGNVPAGNSVLPNHRVQFPTGTPEKSSCDGE